MAIMYNHVTLVGRICTDPQYKEITPRVKKLSFVLAVNRRFKTKDGKTKQETDFVPICIFGLQAEIGKRILIKGQPVLVWGKLRVRNYKKEKETIWITEIVAENFQVLENLSKRLQQECDVESSQEEESVVESSDLDLTKKVIDELNEQNETNELEHQV